MNGPGIFLSVVSVVFASQMVYAIAFSLEIQLNQLTTSLLRYGPASYLLAVVESDVTELNGRYNALILFLTASFTCFQFSQ